MKKASGFTLIELVSVIIILGVLSVTAAPKFLNIQSDARVAVLKGLRAAIKGADEQVYAKAAIQGVESLPEATVTLAGGLTVKVFYGHANVHIGSDFASEAAIVAGNSNSLVDGLEFLPYVTATNGQWTVINASSTSQNLKLAPYGLYENTTESLASIDKCTLSYRVFMDENRTPEFTINEDC